MAVEVAFREDAARVLDEAGAFLASEPVLHNIVLTLLHERAARPKPGRYWVAADSGVVVGVVFQSPPSFAATFTPMGIDAVAASVEKISGAGVELPGVVGEAGTAARFAGQWSERVRGSVALPVEGQRVYELRRLRERVTAAAGNLRLANPDDRALAASWTGRFLEEIGEPERDVGAFVDRMLPAGRIWLWDDEGPSSMAVVSDAVEGAVRVRAVYTPPELRNRGHAEACVRELSRRVLDAGHRCVLYTDLGNPTSNSVYRRIGYEAVAEGLRYRFGRASQ